MKGDQKYLSDISMEISSDSEHSSLEQSFFRTPSKWKVLNRASNSYKIDEKPITLKRANPCEGMKDGIIDTEGKSDKKDNSVKKTEKSIKGKQTHVKIVRTVYRK